MMSKTLEVIHKLERYQIYYKLHPEEYILYKGYQSYTELALFKNIFFLKDCDLYKELAESAYQIGVFSTALYEGMSFNCKTILYNLAGIDYILEKFNNDQIEIYKNDIISNIENAKVLNHEIFT